MLLTSGVAVTRQHWHPGRPEPGLLPRHRRRRNRTRGGGQAGTDIKVQHGGTPGCWTPTSSRWPQGGCSRRKPRNGHGHHRRTVDGLARTGYVPRMLASRESRPPGDDAVGQAAPRRSQHRSIPEQTETLAENSCSQSLTAIFRLLSGCERGHFPQLVEVIDLGESGAHFRGFHQLTPPAERWGLAGVPHPTRPSTTCITWLRPSWGCGSPASNRAAGTAAPIPPC